MGLKHLEPSPFEVDCGETIGRDPRSIPAEDWRQMGAVPKGLRALDETAEKQSA